VGKREDLAAVRTLLPVLFFFSGASALIYESMWTRQFGLIFGNTTYSVTVILATFMGGIALGSFWAARITVRKLVRVYAIAEAGAGLTAFLTFLLLKNLPRWYGSLMQHYPLPAAVELPLRILCSALIILPTTTLLGITFPLLAEFLTRAGGRMQANIGMLYRLNTLGAVCGVLLTTFLLLPRLGVTRVFLVAAAMNLAVGITAWLASRTFQEPAPSLPEVRPGPLPVSAGLKAGAPATAFGPAWPFPLLAFISGFSSFGLEILWTRSMSLVVGSSFYAFNSMLAAFLLGIVLGAAIYEGLWPRMRAPAFSLGLFFMILGAVVLASVALIGALPRVYYDIMVRAGTSFLDFQAIGFALSLFSLLLVTTFFGFTFPLLSQLFRDRQSSVQRITGLLYTWNTLGSILGAVLTGFLLIPAMGIEASYVGLAALLILAGTLVLLAQVKARSIVRLGSCFGAAALLLLAGLYYRPWDRLLMTAGVYKYGLQWRAVIPDGAMLQRSLRQYRALLYYGEGQEGVVSVTRSGSSTFLAINGKIDAGNRADIITQKLLAHVPLMLHPDPRRVFIVGWGSGCTAGSASLYPVEAIDCAEIEPRVFRTAPFFQDLNFEVQKDPRFAIFFKDARNLLLTSGRTYDLIISEPSNPWVSGMSSLFTSEFYAIALQRLASDGIFCQWFHYYDLTLPDVKVQIKTFCRDFPYVSLWLVPPRPAADGEKAAPIGDILLVGSRNPVSLDYQRVSETFRDPAIRRDLNSVSVEDELSFLLNYAADQEDLKAFAGPAPLNTDDLPYIELNAPKGLYAAASHVLEDQFTIYNALAGSGHSPLPPIENYSQLDSAEVYARMAQLLRSKLQNERARRLLEGPVPEL
jgi:spermidine synthase